MPNVWPVGIRKKPKAGTYSEPQDDALAKSPADAGSPRQMRLVTKPTKYVAGTWELDSAEQVETFMAFFNDTCKSGQEPFELEHPRTDVAMDFYFDQVPVPQHIIGTSWQIPLRLRIR